MKILIGAWVAMVLAGCGGSDEPTIEGSWGLTINGSCGVAMTFHRAAPANYAIQIICQTGPNTFASDIELGDADFSTPGKVGSVARRASCPSADHSADTVSYSFSGNRLALAGPEGVAFLDPIPDSPVSQSGTLEFGCWDMGSFEPHAIEDLR